MRSSDLHIRRQPLGAPRWMMALNVRMVSAVVGGMTVSLALIFGLPG